MPELNADTVRYIAVHGSGHTPSDDIGVYQLDREHRILGWFAIGWHYVIRRNGDVEPGRPERQPGAHLPGHNHESIGVALVGGRSRDGLHTEDNFTSEQRAELARLIVALRDSYPNAEVVHNEPRNED